VVGKVIAWGPGWRFFGNLSAKGSIEKDKGVSAVTFDPKTNCRKSIRLPGYDYSQDGAYFVTIFTKNHECVLSQIVTSVGAEASSAPTLSRVIQTFKSICATDYLKYLKKHHFNESARFWQKNYYEHIIRNDTDLTSIREYIRTNPSIWADDAENPRKHRGY
jgi:hypothetical protein